MRGELAAKSRLQGGSGKVGPHPASLRSATYSPSGAMRHLPRTGGVCPGGEGFLESPMSNYNPYTKRQTMIAPDYEVYRYRSTYMNEVELHHHDFYEIYLLLRSGAPVAPGSRSRFVWPGTVVSKQRVRLVRGVDKPSR